MTPRSLTNGDSIQLTITVQYPVTVDMDRLAESIESLFYDTKVNVRLAVHQAGGNVL